MGNRVNFKVQGTSKTKPTNLPDGLTVEEVEVPMKEVFPMLFGRELTVQESSTFGSTHFKLTAPSTAIGSKEIAGYLVKEDVVKLRDLLNEILSGGKRVFQDRDKSTTNRWYEVADNKFNYAADRERAEKAYDRYPSDSWDLTKVEQFYGPLTLVQD